MSYSAAEFWKTIGLIHELLEETTQLVQTMEEIAHGAEDSLLQSDAVRRWMRVALDRHSPEARQLLAICLVGVGDPKAAEIMGIVIERRPVH